MAGTPPGADHHRSERVRHLRAFQRIADENAGVRATGTPGFAASADSVVHQLRAVGYRVRRQAVPYVDYHVGAESAEEVSPQDRQVRTLVMRWSPVTPQGGFTANLVASATPAGTAGCSPDDHAGLPVQGSIVLVARASCGYTAQQQVIAALGGRAMLLYLVTPSPENIWRLHVFMPAAFTIPSATVFQLQAEELAADAAQAPVSLHLELRGHQVSGTTENLFTQTRGGRPDRTVMAGAHLDSVSEGPGINDNVSSGSALLATAIRLAPYQNRVRNMVRFAWWGTEELIDVGSDYYVANLSATERADIALYIDFELIASPNFVRFIMDGGRERPAARHAAGAAWLGRGGACLRTLLRPGRAPLQDAEHRGRRIRPCALHGRRHSHRRNGRRNAGCEDGRRGDDVRRAGPTALRPLLPPALRHAGQHQSPGAGGNVPAIAWVIGRFASDVSDVQAGRTGS